MKYDERHGGPYDRGAADYWYHRPYAPHYFVGGTYMSDMVDMRDMTPEEIDAYRAGYDASAERGDRKDWGDDE